MPIPHSRINAPPRPRRTALSDEEIRNVEVPPAPRRPHRGLLDEGVRADTTAETLAKLRPAFAPEGTVTAGSASQISDGGAAVAVTSRARGGGARRAGASRIGAHG